MFVFVFVFSFVFANTSVTSQQNLLPSKLLNHQVGKWRRENKGLYIQTLYSVYPDKATPVRRDTKTLVVNADSQQWVLGEQRLTLWPS